MSLSLWEHSCPNYEMRFAPEPGLMRVSWDSLFGNLFRASLSLCLPLGEGGAKRRVRAGNAPSSGPSGHLLPEGEGHEHPFRLIWTPRLSLWERLPEGERHANSRSTRESVAEQETRDQEVLPARTENWLHISKADAP